MFDKIQRLKQGFDKHGGVLKTLELNDLGFSSRQISMLMKENVISRIKHGFYESTEYSPRAEVVIARLFPEAIVFLESALIHYEYTDRIPSSWQIAVDKDSQKSKYDLGYIRIEPFYLEPKYLNIGIDIKNLDGVEVKIYDRDRTICDTLRYEKKLEDEVFSNAIKRYIDDSEHNIRKLFEYAEVFNITKKVQTYVGIWL